MKDEDLHILDQYFRNELSGEDKEEIEFRIATEPSFKEKAYELRHFIFGIKIMGQKNLIAQMIKWDGEIEPVTKMKRRRYYYWVAAAITILVILASIKVYHINQPKQLFTEYYTTPLTNQSPSRGVENELIKSAFDAFKNEEYKVSERLFSDYLNQEQYVDEIQFFYAISLFEQGKEIEAIAELEDLIKKSDQEEYRWYLGIIYLKVGNSDDGVQILSSLNGSDKYTKRANEIIKHLQR